MEGDRWPQHWCREVLFQPGARCQATPPLFEGTSATWRLGGVISQEFANERDNQGQGFHCFAELEQNCEGAHEAGANWILALDPRSVTALPALWFPDKCIFLMSFLTWDIPHVSFQASKCPDNQLSGTLGKSARLSSSSLSFIVCIIFTHLIWAQK